MPSKKGPKAIGVVTHYYSSVGVAIVKFNKAVKMDEEIHFKGATTDFIQQIASMQFDHKNIASAKKGQEVGIKVSSKVREGDQVFEVV